VLYAVGVKKSKVAGVNHHISTVLAYKTVEVGQSATKFSNTQHTETANSCYRRLMWRGTRRPALLVLVLVLMLSVAAWKRARSSACRSHCTCSNSHQSALFAELVLLFILSAKEQVSKTNHLAWKLVKLVACDHLRPYHKITQNHFSL
jgi:hypothetical protein